MKSLSNIAINELRRNARNVVRELGLLNDAYFEIGVTLAERHLLIELNNCQSPTMGEIADRLLLDKSTISRLISNAVKKGYVECITEDKDKRKRFLNLTEKGKLTLNAFEPIAFKQTKDALLTLNSEEIETIHKGVALYAKGLKSLRIQNKAETNNATSHLIIAGDGESTKIKKIESLGEINNCLIQMGYTLDPYEKKDEEGLYSIFREVVDSGSQFPYECKSIEEFHRQFFSSNSRVYVCHALSGEVVGGFYLKVNYSGRSNHIGNAAYMMRNTCRGKGVGTLLIKASLHFANELGLRAMQFNMVLSQNHLAVKLYEKLGFCIIGTIPQSVRNSDGSFQDGYVMHRTLDNL
ncbi:MAG: MarR family transcriptional regulator [Parachlamydiaceae bacterium]|nr:MarR family transcriptional regulator [Parachlamydiaceae bacterium]